MEIARRVNMVQSGCHLLKDASHKASSQRSPLVSSHELVEVSFHSFKNEVQLRSFACEKDVIERNDTGMGG